MITRGCLFLALMVNYVLSLPVSSHHTENEDVKVMKCIVEVIADALSKPNPIPVSQGCLDSLRTDTRLISILRRQNFLKELQDIALQGANERALNPDEGGAADVTDRLGGSTALKDSPDRSMLAFLERPGEKAAMPEKRESEDDSMVNEGKSQEAEPDKRISNSLNEDKVTRANLEGDAEKKEDGSDRDEVDDVQVKSGGETEPAKIPAEVKSPEEEPGSEGVQKTTEERRDFDRPEKRKEEEEEEEREPENRGETDELSEGPSSRKQAEGEPVGGGATEGIPHHSKEEEDNGGREEEEEARRSPEALELQMMARRETEEGSANRRTEDHEVESLAAIESELESMAQKLHELRRG
ncbi:chromogranin-A-like [Anguilla anguilla]|uniref:chromogranin-A-like n=1 Tax=Anguilla anguilla TaxID=7936 RepID=UPI0015B36896|nr:chromogranin-A-like [Anguilla anguilla]